MSLPKALGFLSSLALLLPGCGGGGALTENVFRGSWQGAWSEDAPSAVVQMELSIDHGGQADGTAQHPLRGAGEVIGRVHADGSFSLRTDYETGGPGLLTGEAQLDGGGHMIGAFEETGGFGQVSGTFDMAPK